MEFVIIEINSAFSPFIINILNCCFWPVLFDSVL
jgi:hypothetical protein